MKGAVDAYDAKIPIVKFAPGLFGKAFLQFAIFADLRGRQRSLLNRLSKLPRKLSGKISSGVNLKTAELCLLLKISFEEETYNTHPTGTSYKKVLLASRFRSIDYACP